MNNTVNNSASAWGAFRRWFYVIAVLLALLLGLLWLLGYGPGRSACKVPVAAAAAPAAAPAVVAPPVAAPAPVAEPASAVAQAAPPPAPVPAAEPAPAAPVAAAATAGLPEANVYFALDKYKLPAGTNKTLSAVVSYLKKNAGAKASVSGFHDPTGNAAYNEQLAENRARAVRGALQAMGIARDRVVMEKPTTTTGSGTPQEARRVEVRVRE